MVHPEESVVLQEALELPGVLLLTGHPAPQEVCPIQDLHRPTPGALQPEAVLAEVPFQCPGVRRHTEVQLLLPEALLLPCQGVLLHRTEVRLLLPGVHLLPTEAVLPLPPGLTPPVAAVHRQEAIPEVPAHTVAVAAAALIHPEAAALIPPAAAVHRRVAIPVAHVHRAVEVHVLRIDNHEKDYTLHNRCGSGFACSRTIMGPGAAVL